MRTSETKNAPEGASRCRALASGLSGPGGGTHVSALVEDARKLGRAGGGVKAIALPCFSPQSPLRGGVRGGGWGWSDGKNKTPPRSSSAKRPSPQGGG